MNGALPFFRQAWTGQRWRDVGCWADLNRNLLAFPKLKNRPLAGCNIEGICALPDGRQDHRQRETSGIGKGVVEGQRQPAIATFAARRAMKVLFHSINPA